MHKSKSEVTQTIPAILNERACADAIAALQFQGTVCVGAGTAACDSTFLDMYRSASKPGIPTTTTLLTSALFCRHTSQTEPPSIHEVVAMQEVVCTLAGAVCARRMTLLKTYKSLHYPETTSRVVKQQAGL